MEEKLLNCRRMKGMPTCMIIFLTKLDSEEDNAIWNTTDNRNAEIQLAELRKNAEELKEDVWLSCLKIMEYSIGIIDTYYWFLVLKMLKCEMAFQIK